MQVLYYWLPEAVLPLNTCPLPNELIWVALISILGVKSVIGYLVSKGLKVKVDIFYDIKLNETRWRPVCLGL